MLHPSSEYLEHTGPTALELNTCSDFCLLKSFTMKSNISSLG